MGVLHLWEEVAIFVAVGGRAFDIGRRQVTGTTQARADVVAALAGVPHALDHAPHQRVRLKFVHVVVYESLGVRV